MYAYAWVLYGSFAPLQFWKDSEGSLLTPIVNAEELVTKLDYILCVKACPIYIMVDSQGGHP